MFLSECHESPARHREGAYVTWTWAGKEGRAGKGG
jgi:hypothetical protein